MAGMSNTPQQYGCVGPQLRKIFVSGFSRHTTAAQVAEYFAPFGFCQIEKYESFFKRHQTKHDFQGGDGYFILSDLHPNTYSRILQATPHMFAGRCLDVCPLKTGLDLILYNSQKNQRKVLLKKVPASISQDYILAQLLTRFGPVERIFSYKSDKGPAGIYPVDTKLITYSVTFKGKISAAKAAEKKHLLIDKGQELFIILIEKFKRTTIDQIISQLGTIQERNPTRGLVDPAVFQTKTSYETPIHSEDTHLTGSVPQGIEGYSSWTAHSQDSAKLPNPGSSKETSPAKNQARAAKRKQRKARLRLANGPQHEVKPTSNVYRMRVSGLEDCNNLVFNQPVIQMEKLLHRTQVEGKTTLLA